MSRMIYIEESVMDHPVTRTLCARFPQATLVTCERYSEIFNRRGQNFRLQKKQPAIILARKHEGHVLPAPSGYGLDGERHFYFSHMLNCVYDCRYCFLQGMYRSAHYVIFVNHEDYFTAIENTIHEAPDSHTWFYSGYDCDSLAYEPVTRFAEHFVPLFRQHPDAWLELRTKSTQIRSLLAMEPVDNCVVAFSFTPQGIAEKLEQGVPAVSKRIKAMQALHEHGWRIGLRLDPLIYHQHFHDSYRTLLDTLFADIRPDVLHSASLGTFRMPRGFFDNMYRLYPEEKLFAGPLEEQNGMIGYRSEHEQALLKHCETLLLQYLPQDRYFPCHDLQGADSV